MTPTPGGAADVRLLSARHSVVNTLVRYLRAVDDHDLDAVLAQLEQATVSFGGPARRGVQELTDTYRSAFAAGGRTRHLLHEVEVAWAGDGHRVVVWAAYQRWSLDSEPPTVTAIGQYRARFDVDAEQVRLIDLTVDRDWQRS